MQTNFAQAIKHEPFVKPYSEIGKEKKAISGQLLDVSYLED